MKLKYYLRGIGIGVILTAIVMGFALGGRKTTMSDAEVIERAKELGMTDGGVLSDSVNEGDEVEESNTSSSDQALDEAGFTYTPIMAYSAKFASGYYGPFRDAAHSAPGFGDRKTYQMDYRTHNQGLEEIAADIEEGADWTMVKPAMPYLDMIARGVERFPQTPMVAYQVSGEYSMLKAAAKLGYLDEQRVVFESLIAIKRAGAQYIISYYAKEYMQRWA